MKTKNIVNNSLSEKGGGEGGTGIPYMKRERNLGFTYNYGHTMVMGHVCGAKERSQRIKKRRYGKDRNPMDGFYLTLAAFRLLGSTHP